MFSRTRDANANRYEANELIDGYTRSYEMERSIYPKEFGIAFFPYFLAMT